MKKKWVIKNNKIIQIKKKKNNEWCSLKRDLQKILELENKVEKLTFEKKRLQQLIYSKKSLVKKYKTLFEMSIKNQVGTKLKTEA